MKQLNTVRFIDTLHVEFHNCVDCCCLRPNSFLSIGSVKLNPPPKPKVNLTTVSWSCQAQKHVRIVAYEAELWWRAKDQPWRVCVHLLWKSKAVTETSIHLSLVCFSFTAVAWNSRHNSFFLFHWQLHLQTPKSCQLNCSIQLPDDIILGEWYEARVRVQPSNFRGHWSEWSPTVAWKARVGRVKSVRTPPGKAEILTFKGTLTSDDSITPTQREKFAHT